MGIFDFPSRKLTFSEALREFAEDNLPIKDTLNTVGRDLNNRSSLAYTRDILSGLTKTQYLEKKELKAIVFKVFDSSDKINTKIYAVPFSYDTNSVKNKEVFNNSNIDYSKLEYMVFYPTSVDLINENKPKVGDIIRVQLAPNYPNHTNSNARDNMFMGKTGINIDIQIENEGVQRTEEQKRLFEQRARETFKENAPLTKVEDNDLLQLPYPAAIDPFITSLCALRDDPLGQKPAYVHKGIDIAIDINTPVLAPIKMQIIDINTDRTNPSGLQITGQQLTQDGKLKKDGYKYIFKHLNRIIVNEGDIIESQKAIGYSGNTGARSTGAHLHFEVHLAANDNFVNPFYLLVGTVKITNQQKEKIGFPSEIVALPLNKGSEGFVDKASPVTKPTTPPNSSLPLANASQTDSSNPALPNASGSPPITRPKMMLTSLDIDKAKGVRIDNNVGTSYIKVREDIYNDLFEIKKTLNRYDISFTCNGFIPSLTDKNQSLLAKVGLEVRLNSAAGLTAKMNTDTDDYLVGPDYQKPYGSFYKLKIYAPVRRKLVYIDDKYQPITSQIDIYDIRETGGKSAPKILKVFKTYIDLTKLFEDYGFIQAAPKNNFFLKSDNIASNWFIFQKSAKIVKGYTQKELLSTVYKEDKESIWQEPTLVWDGSKFI